MPTELTPLQKAQAAQQAKRDAGEPVVIRTKADLFAEKDTRKTAIELFCCQCMGGEDNPGYRSLIRECSCGPDSILPCSLFKWRPYK